MKTTWRVIHHASPIARSLGRRWASDSSHFAANDYALLEATTRLRDISTFFVGPLTPGSTTKVQHKGNISHNNIIGKTVRDVVEVAGPKGIRVNTFRLRRVSLEDYVRLSRRLVTPIYSADANLIVSLFDLHPEPPGQGSDTSPQIEILEAGTGHGSLTLHLSRAVHAANGTKPNLEDGSTAVNEQELKVWKEKRQAIIHSVEVSPVYSKHASSVVSGFRRGQYRDNVDFHIGNVSNWLTAALKKRSGEAFLTHAFLDLPGVHDHVASVAGALKADGTLIIFCPSITQINKCALTVREKKVPLWLDKVLELGSNGSTGGRLWDVRLVKPRATQKRTERKSAVSTAAAVVEAEGEQAVSHNAVSGLDAAGEQDTSPNEVTVGSASDQEESATNAVIIETTNGQGPDTPAAEPSNDRLKQDDDDWQMICRPKVGELTTGGGFLAIFRRKASDDSREALPTSL